MPCVPAAQLTAHLGPCNGVVWAPHSAGHLSTVSDDKRTLIWDFTKVPEVYLNLMSFQPSSFVIKSRCRLERASKLYYHE